MPDVSILSFEKSKIKEITFLWNLRLLAVLSGKSVNLPRSLFVDPRPWIFRPSCLTLLVERVFTEKNMPLTRPAILLFGLNLLDALLTIIWVRSGVATESNQLMASLLDIGNAPFLIVKVAIGAVAAVVIMRWGSRPLARYGLAVALAVYIGLMGIHIFTGLAAFGYVANDVARGASEPVVGFFSAVFSAIPSLF